MSDDSFEEFSAALTSATEDLGDGEAVLGVFKMFAERLPGRLNELQNASDAGNFKLMSEIAHKEKGACQCLKLDDMAADFAVVEDSGKQQQCAERGLLERLHRKGERLLVYLASVMPG